MPIILKNQDPTTVPTPASGKTAFGTNNSDQLFLKDDTGAVTVITSGGTVTSVAVNVNAGIGVSGTPITSSGTITLDASNLTPTTVAATGTVTGSNLSGTNTGDQTITLTGDVTGSGTGSFAATLANTAVTPGSYTSANITVDAKGRITAAASGTPVTPGGSNTQVQFNNSGAFGANAGLLYNGTNTLTVGETATANAGTIQLNTVSTRGYATIWGDATTALGESGMFLLPAEGISESPTGSTLNLYGGLGYSGGNGTGGLVRVAGGLGFGTGRGGDVEVSGGFATGTGDQGMLVLTGNRLEILTSGGNRLSIGSAGGWTVNGSAGTAGQVLTSNGASANPSWTTVSSGTVTSVGITGNDGIDVTSSPITTSGNIVLDLGNITPTSVAAVGTVTGSNLSGTNTGDQTITLTGDVTGSGTGSFATTLANTAVTAGSYTYSSITVDSKGRITAASSGTAPVTGVTIDESSTSSTKFYPLFTDATTGSVSALDIASGRLSFTPSKSGAISSTESTLEIGGSASGQPAVIRTPNTTSDNAASLFIIGGNSTIGQGGNITLTTGGGSVSNDGAVYINALGGVVINTGNTDRFAILNNGSWTLGPSYDSGTAGQVLTSSGSSAAPTWTTLSSGLVAPKYQEFAATSGQTVFNTTLTTTAKASGRAYLQVYVNGVFQMEGASKAYTVTGTTQITFNSGLTLNDDVVIYGYV